MSFQKLIVLVVVVSRRCEGVACNCVLNSWNRSPECRSRNLDIITKKFQVSFIKGGFSRLKGVQVWTQLKDSAVPHKEW